MVEDTQLENVQDILPLSPTQEGVLFEVLADPTAEGRYNSLHRVTLEGPLDVAAFERCFTQAALATDISRASFVHEGVDRPLQVIRTKTVLPFAFEDWSGQSDLDAALDKRGEDLLRTSYRLTDAPLMRAQLLRTGATSHVLLWSIHHLISDAWSTRIVLEDTLAALNGAAPKAPGPSFRDHLSRLASRDRDADHAYFSRQLAGLDTPSLLAPDHAAGLGLFQHHGQRLSIEASQRLKAFAQSQRVTLATALYLAWGLCLRRYIGHADVVFGRVTAGRDASVPGIDRAIGPYLTTVPTRLHFDGQMTVEETLATAHATFTAARPHEGAGLTETIPEGTGRLPFDTLVSIQGFGLPDADGPLQATAFEGRDATGFPFALILRPGQEIEIEAVFDTARIPPPMAADLVSAYALTLDGMARAPQTPISELPGLPLPPMSAGPDAPLVPDLIAHQARHSPKAVAVVCGSDRLSYGALHGGAQALAKALAAEGVGPGDIVPVAAERSVNTVIAILATHYAGAAFAPLDPAYPVERNKAILDTLAPKCVLGDTPLPGWSGLVLSAHPVQDTDAFTLPALAREATAYVIHTSGSTGHPKGVVISQGNLAWSTAARGPVYGSTPSAFLHLSSFAFDSAMVGLFWTLSTGGKLVIAPPRAEQDPKALLHLAAREGVSHLLCLPQLWSAILETAPAPTELETVIVAGEAVMPSLTARHRTRAPGVRLFNEYGPTEGTIWCAAAEITDETEAAPIGRAPPGAALDICDIDGWRMPHGLQGELVIRGDGVAQGYLSGDGGFADHPDQSYRTGDIGSYRADGALMCHGRRDEQVKIRGYRVELGEIEAAARVAGAKQSLAAADGGRIVLAVTDEVTDLKAALAERLPPHMRPAAIHKLAELPTLPNGKLDRSAVAQLGAQATAEETRPDGYLETMLAEIWETVLGHPVGPETHFFAAGGDSLMTITVVCAAEAEGLILRPGDMFDHPVLSDLAAALRARMAAPLHQEANRRVSVANDGGTATPVLMIHGSVEFNASLAGILGPNRPCIFSWSHHIAGTARLRDGVQAQAQDAIEAINEHVPEGPVIIIGYSIGAVIAQAVADLLSRSGRQVISLIMVDPTTQIAPPTGQAEPVARFAMRWAKAGYSAGRVLLGMAGDRLQRTGHVYRAAIAPHRIKPYSGRGQVLYTYMSDQELAARKMASPGATLVPLPYEHLQIIDDGDAIADVVLRISAHIRACEKETGG